MIDLEKTIHNLDGAHVFVDSRAKMATGTDGAILLTSWAKAIEDSITLLKAQVPRLLTLQETIESYGNPVWLEENTSQGSCGAWGVIKGFHDKYNAVNIGGVIFTYWPIMKYNKSWRCWTARPTEEQRKAPVWDAN